MNTTTTNPKALTNAAEQQAMVENMPLVRKIAHRCADQPWARPFQGSIDDMVSAGCIGLIYAIRAYRPESGCKFSTLCWTVVVRILKKAAEYEGLVHGARQRGDRPLRHTPQIALNNTAAHNAPARTSELSFDDEEEAIAYQAAKALSCLSDQELHIIRRRFFDEAKLKDVGTEIGLSRERVRQLESWSLRKMRRCLEVDAEVRTTRHIRHSYTPEGLARAA